MEFSDEFSTFQLKPLNHVIASDFSTEFAKNRKRRLSRTVSSSSTASTSSSSVKKESLNKVRSSVFRFDKQTLMSLCCLLTIVIAIVLPLFQPSTRTSSDDLFEKYITVSEKPVIIKKEIDSATNSEALKSVQAALEMKRNKKVDKARKLFEHAVALSPHNAHVLLHYGRFLEEFGQPPHDLLEADHQYIRAVAFSIANSETRIQALEGRRRTADKVDLIDDEVLKRIDQKKRKFLKVNQNSEILNRVKREAYIQYIYHTVGIEGNTMNLAQTRSILETKLAVGGKSIMEHNEILGMDSALKYINNTLVDKMGQVTLDDILEVHKRVLGNVEPVDAGVLRRVQVFVGDHVPPPPWSLAALLDKFVVWLNSHQALALHPVRLAALAHYKLVHIHPWVDGNGRTSRLLMNVVLMQAGFPPVIIRRADREVYYQHLVTANEGDIRPFIRFIAECTENTLDAYLWASKEYYGPPLGELGSDDEELPLNLVEHSLEQVNTQLGKLTGGSPWLNFEPTDHDSKVIVSEELEKRDLDTDSPGPV